MKYTKYTFFLIIALLFNSCEGDFLNPIPDSAIVVDSFFASDDDVLSGITGIYDALQGVNVNTEYRGLQFEFMVTEMRSDNTSTATLEGSRADFHRYRVDPTNVQSEDYWQSMYQIIFRANNVLNFIDVADASNQSAYAAEARFLRAIAYFRLVRLYGAVPMVTSVVSPGEDELLFTRVDEDQVYAQIISDLQDAVANLDNSFKSRASKAAAQGILAKVLMTQANPDYAGAQQLLEEIINSGEFSLQNNFRDVFYNELNDEIIFAIQYQTGKGNRTEVSFVTFGSKNEVTKFLPDGSDVSVFPPTYGPSPGDAGNDLIVLRYADVLLLHAEAILGGSAQTSSGAAINSYMAVRTRAGFDAADRPAALTSGDLLVERRVELAFENHRFHDLVRFGVADAVLGAHAAENGFTEYNARKLLLPIPSREINLSRGLLTQNPGY